MKQTKHKNDGSRRPGGGYRGGGGQVETNHDKCPLCGGGIGGEGLGNHLEHDCPETCGNESN